MSTQQYTHKTWCIAWVCYQVSLHYSSYVTSDFHFSRFRTGGSTAISAHSHYLALYLQGKIMTVSRFYVKPAHVSLQQQYYTMSPSPVCQEKGATWFLFLPEMHNFHHSGAYEMHIAESSCKNIYLYFEHTEILKSPRGLPSLKMSLVQKMRRSSW